MADFSLLVVWRERRSTFLILVFSFRMAFFLPYDHGLNFSGLFSVTIFEVGNIYHGIQTPR